MARTRQPELPNCAPMPLRFKEVPCENGSGEPLKLCKSCEGSGEICTAEKKTFGRDGQTVVETLTAFPGSLRQKRQRGGVDGDSNPLRALQWRRTGPCAGI